MKLIKAGSVSLIIFWVLSSYLYAGMNIHIQIDKITDSAVTVAGKGYRVVSKKTFTNFKIMEQSSIGPVVDPNTIILYDNGDTYLKNGFFFIEANAIYLQPGSFVTFEGLPPNAIIDIEGQKFEGEKIKDRKIKILLKNAELVEK
jgi:hypothetical protein